MTDDVVVTPRLDRWGKPVRRRNRWTHVSHPHNGDVWRLDGTDWDLEFDAWDGWFLWVGGRYEKHVDRYLASAMEWAERRYHQEALNWHIELADDFPQLEIYFGHGWGPEQELGQYELGERVMEEQALWLPSWFYSETFDRHFAATLRMFAMVVDRIRRDHRGLDEAELVLRALRGEGPDDVSQSEIPPGWLPDADYWERERKRR